MKDVTLDAFCQNLDCVIAPRDDLQAIRQFNHFVIDELEKVEALHGKRLLDLACSPWGFALERALELGADYTGVTLAVPHVSLIRNGSSLGRMFHMDAARLAFRDESFDVALSVSSFEHFLDPGTILAELYRVLVPGGHALLNCDPVWSSALGHHLHQFPTVSAAIPAWGHLRGEAWLRSSLSMAWPPNLPMTLDQALHWIYHSNEINRMSAFALRNAFESSQFRIQWIAALPNEPSAGDPPSDLPYSREELVIRGYSLMVVKAPQRYRHLGPVVLQKLGARVLHWFARKIRGLFVGIRRGFKVISPKNA